VLFLGQVSSPPPTFLLAFTFRWKTPNQIFAEGENRLAGAYPATTIIQEQGYEGHSVTKSRTVYSRLLSATSKMEQ
jgi:hypothetical protein